MSSPSRFDFRLTGLSRFAAYSLLLLLAFFAAGCRQGERLAAAPSLVTTACGEGMLAAQAWKCLASGAAHP